MADLVIPYSHLSESAQLPVLLCGGRIQAGLRLKSAKECVLSLDEGSEVVLRIPITFTIEYHGQVSEVRLNREFLVMDAAIKQ